MKLSELCLNLRGKLFGDADVTGLCTDSRVAGAGELFFCFCGTHTDAHDFAAEAYAKGAAAIICERKLPLPCAQFVAEDGREAMAMIAAAFYQHPERKMKFVGVTGTNGKTTTCHYLCAILEACGIETGMIGTLGARFAGRSIAPDLTTPDPVSLFSLLSEMQKAGVEAVVMEVSAHALALKKVAPILFDCAIFTNLTRDHLDFFGDMEAYGAAKKLLFSKERCKMAVLNADDGFSKELEALGTPFFTYGMDTPADAFAIVEKEDLFGSEVILNLSDELCGAKLALTGAHNVQNALAAACASKLFGAGAEQISAGLEAVKRVDGRLERVGEIHGAQVFVDFAHTPDGLEKSLSCLKERCTGKLYALFGCGGNRDTGKRKIMGETAAKWCDFCVITSDNPRFEDPCAIISEIEEGYLKDSGEYTAIEERDKAIEYALNLLNEGDVLLVAGKGGENYQEIMGIKYDFNDKELIQKLIGKLE